MAANCPKKGTPATQVSLPVRQVPREEYSKRTTDESVEAATVNAVKQESSLKEQIISTEKMQGETNKLP